MKYQLSSDQKQAILELVDSLDDDRYMQIDVCDDASCTEIVIQVREHDSFELLEEYRFNAVNK